MSATIFFALALCGLGALSAFTARDIITVPGLGQAPGIVAMVFAILSFVVGVAAALRRERASFLSVPMNALSAALVHVVVIWIGVLISSGDLVVSTAVAGDFVRGGVSAVILLAAAIAAWIGIALRRTAAKSQQWPWERPDPDED